MQLVVHRHGAKRMSCKPSVPLRYHSTYNTDPLSIWTQAQWSSDDQTAKLANSCWRHYDFGGYSDSPLLVLVFHFYFYGHYSVPPCYIAYCVAWCTPQFSCCFTYWGYSYKLWAQLHCIAERNKFTLLKWICLTSMPKLDVSGSNWVIFVLHFQTVVQGKGHFDGSLSCLVLSPPAVYRGSSSGRGYRNSSEWDGIYSYCHPGSCWYLCCARNLNETCAARLIRAQSS